jgi:hypothetical protein
LSSRPVDRGRRLLLAARHATQLGKIEAARRLLRQVDVAELQRRLVRDGAFLGEGA